MQFPNIRIQRLLGKKTLFYLPKAKKIIIDPGYNEGDIHIYSWKLSTSARNLNKILKKYLGTDEIGNKTTIDVNEVGKDVTFDIFQYADITADMNKVKSDIDPLKKDKYK